MIPNHIKKAIAKWLIAGLEKIEQDYYKEARELNDQMVRQAKNKSQVSVSSRHLIWNENIDMEGSDFVGLIKVSRLSPVGLFELMRGENCEAVFTKTDRK
jgi:hypothetical protein